MAKSIDKKAAELLAFAQEARKTARDWIQLHNAVFGIGGKFGQLFTQPPERVHASKTPQFAQVTEMIDELRATQGDDPFIAEIGENAQGKISLRVPASMHVALLAEAHAEGVSLNQLCLAKLAIQLRALTGGR